jgi:hypothetical protein
VTDGLASRVATLLVQVSLRGGAAGLGLFGAVPLGLLVIVFLFPGLFMILENAGIADITAWLLFCLIPLFSILGAILALVRPLAGGGVLLIAASLFWAFVDAPFKREGLPSMFPRDNLVDVVAIWLVGAALAFLASLLGVWPKRRTTGFEGEAAGPPSIGITPHDRWLRQQAALLGVTGGLANLLSAWLAARTPGSDEPQTMIAFLVAALLGFIGGSKVVEWPLVGGLAMLAGVIVAIVFGSAFPAFGIALTLLLLLVLGAVLGLAAAWRERFRSRGA